MKISTVAYLASDAIFAYGMHLFYKKFFPQKEEKNIRWMALVLFVIVDFVFYLLISNLYFFPIVSFLTFFSVSIVYQRNMNFRNILAAFWILTFGICGELLASYMVSFVMGVVGNDNPENALVAALVSARFLFFFMTMVAAKLISHQREGNPVQYISAITMFLPVISVGLIIYVFSLAEFDQNTILSAGSMGAISSVIAIVWINLITVWLFDRESHARQMEREAQALRITVQVQQEHYNGEMEKREAIRKIRHDYKNFLLAVQADIEAGKMDEVKKTIEKELQSEAVSGFAQSGWYALDAVVSYKESLAHKKGIGLVPEYFIEKEPEVASEDICVMMGNALDNAIEYLDTHPMCPQEIRIHVRYEKGVLNIKIGNAVEKTIEITDKRFCLSSKSGEGHGYGLKSIDYIANKYDGRIILSSREDYFECGIIMYC